jgi:predicted metalloprotease with PDZ domain
MSKIILLLITLVVGFTTAAEAEPPVISYHVVYDDNEALMYGTISVEVRFDATLYLSSSTYEWVHPRAVPSAYDQHMYDNYVEQLRGVTRSGRSLSATKEWQGPRWTINGASPNDPLSIVTYRMNISQMEREVLSSVDSCRLRPSAPYAMMLGYAIFGYLDLVSVLSIPLSLTVTSTNSAIPVICTLNPSSQPTSTCSGVASEYYELADSQIIIGTNRIYLPLTQTNNGYISIYNEQSSSKFDAKLVTSYTSEAYRNVNAWFGNKNPTPNDNNDPMEKMINTKNGVTLNSFVVAVELLSPLTPDHGYGFSVEHLNSASINVAWGTIITNNTDYDTRTHFVYNLAHHITHAWLPKRCYGRYYRPHSWELLPVIDTIWFNEGWGQWIAMEAMALPLPKTDANRYRQFIMQRFRSVPPQSPRVINDMALPYLSQ